MPIAPDPMTVHPLPAHPRVVFLRPLVRSAQIEVGEFTYFDDPDAPEEDEYDLDYGESGSEPVDEGDYPQLTATARRIDELRPLPRELADLVAACLEPAPELRPPVDELMGKLEPLGAGT